ncbi:MAG: MBOAT family protein, partial [Candidatus Omnitrophica bacterium]|nr:MBOAT family protein [Candidatus Omnitrophota bacterium]
MLFNSLTFFIFFLFVLIIYYGLLPKKQNIVLLCASYIFYAWWDWRFLSLILISTAVDYFCGAAIARHSESKKRKMYLWISIAANLSILGFFKYFNFFIDSLTVLFEGFGLRFPMATMRIIL